MKAWKIISLICLGIILFTGEINAQFENSTFMRYRYCYAGKSGVDIRNYEFVSDYMVTIELNNQGVIVYLPDESIGYPITSVEYDDEEDCLCVDCLTVDREKIRFVVHNEYCIIFLPKRKVLVFTTKPL